MTYKGFTAEIEVDEDARELFGRVTGLRDVITFRGETLTEFVAAFHESVDDYLAMCAARREAPEQPEGRRKPTPRPDGPKPTVPFFQQVDPPGRRPGVCWLASLYLADGGQLTRPVATAWLTDLSPTLGVVMDFILVPDQHRRSGHAKELIKACQDRWPNLLLTDPISFEGERLAEAVGHWFGEA